MFPLGQKGFFTCKTVQIGRIPIDYGSNSRDGIIFGRITSQKLEIQWLVDNLKGS